MIGCWDSSEVMQDRIETSPTRRGQYRRATMKPSHHAKVACAGLIALGLQVIACIAPAGAALADAGAGASDWSAAQNARMRLIAAGKAPDGHFRAGIEIELAPHYKTYWRAPGDSGVPPQFDFSGSDNLGKASVAFPVPHVYDDGAGRSIGYKDRVVLPVEVSPADPARPVTLKVKIDYGVCDKVCIPAEGTAELRLPQDGTNAVRDLLAAAQATLPRITSLDAPGAIGIARFGAVAPVDGHAAFEVEARGPAPLDLLADATPADWYLEAKPIAGDPGLKRFRVVVFDPDGKQARVPCAIRLTLVSGESAIEVPVSPAGCVEAP